MTEPKKPRSGAPSQGPAPRTGIGPGRSGTAGSIGKELGGDLDFEPDALLDSLLLDEPHPPSVDPALGPKLHEPASRSHSPDEITGAHHFEDHRPPAAQPAEAAAGGPALGAPSPSEPAESWSVGPATGVEANTAEPGADPQPEQDPNAQNHVRGSDFEADELTRPRAPAGEFFVPRAPRAPDISRPGRPVAGVPRPAHGEGGTPRPRARSSPPPRPSPPAPTAIRPLEGETAPAPPVAEHRSAEPTAKPDADLTPPPPAESSALISDVLAQFEKRPPPVSMQPLVSVPAEPVSDSDLLLGFSGAPQGDNEPASLEPATGSSVEASLLSFEDDAAVVEPDAVPEPLERAQESAPAVEIQARVDTLESADAAEETVVGVSLPASFAPPSEPAPRWASERPAYEHLGGQTELWVQRAERLEAEAQRLADPQAKARALLVASELWALVGDTQRAREVAGAASAGARPIPVASRQARWLAAVDGDWAAVSKALELEARSAAGPDARAHAAYLNSEVQRLLLDDEESATQALDAALRAKPDEPRVHVARLAAELAKSAGPPRVRLPDAPELGELGRAARELRRLRGAPASAEDPGGPSAAFADAHRALSNGDRAAAADALHRLASVRELRTGAMWLAAALLGAEATTRPQALALLADLVLETRSSAARRALAARALEQGDGTAVQQAVGSASAESSFGLGDRLTLAALTGLSPQALGGAIADALADPELRPLALALLAVTPGQSLDPGASPALAELKLGKTLGSLGSLGTESDRWAALAPDAQRFIASHETRPLSRLLALELALHVRAPSELAKAFADWPTEQPDAKTERDHLLASALMFELAGDPGAAASGYRGALDLDPTLEAALRALLAGENPERAAELFQRFAEHCSGTPQAGVLFVEAALRHGREHGELHQELLKHAAQEDPDLSIAYRLSEEAARRSGDSLGLLAVLRARREASSDAAERAFDEVREALLISDTELDVAAELLERVVETRPTEIAVRELHERLAQSGHAERAAWRESVASLLGGDAQRSLLAEATLEYALAGDPENAARAGFVAAELGAGELVRVLAERAAPGTAEADKLIAALSESAAAESAPELQQEAYERLIEIERARGDEAATLRLGHSLLERSPQHLPALRSLERAYLRAGRLEELEPIAATLAELLERGEAAGHALLAHRVRKNRGAFAEATRMAELVLKKGISEQWALCWLLAQGRNQSDPELLLGVARSLFELATRPLDKATLGLRAAEYAERLGHRDQARELLEAAIQQVPDHVVALRTLAQSFDAAGDATGAAKTLEALAEAYQVDAHKVEAWHQAAVLWLDRLGNPERGRLALEHALALDMSHEDSVTRLQELYAAAGERQRLAELLERRLERTEDPEERVAIEVARGRVLFEVGERSAAKSALARALDESPDHTEALEAFADLCLGDGDWPAAEQALIRLARHIQDPTRQAHIYRRLGELYDTMLPNPERAELAYSEVLKRDPDDAVSVARLVQVYGRLGNTAAAITLQNELLARAQTPDQRRDRTLALALVEEQLAGDRKKAEGLFERARKDWPHDGKVLRALVEFRQRGGETAAGQMLLDRAASDARRALATGRFEPAFFEVLATVAELRGSGDGAAVAAATLSALRGEDASVHPFGPGVGTPEIDELLAPEVVSGALRTLLKKTGDLLDAAYPLDLRALRAVPLPVESRAFSAFVSEVGEKFGLFGVQCFSSPALGPVCIPVSAAPAQLLFGQALLNSSDDAARYFLLIRAMKLLQANAAAFSRTAPVDMWPVLAAYLGLFDPNMQPQGVDPKKLADAQRRLQSVPRRRFDEDVPLLALEVLGAIGNRASLLGTALHQWGDRAGLVAVGSLAAALRGIAFAAGHAEGPPPEGPERLKWIVRNPEARDLAIFSVSEQHGAIRARLSGSG